MSIAAEVVAFLDLSAVGTSAVTLFADEMPDAPVECLVVQDYPGRAPEYILGQALPNLEFYSVQVKVRAATKTAARTLIRSAYNALAPIRNQTVGSAFWLKATPLQQPSFLSMDANRKPSYVFNMEIEKRR